MNDVNLRAGRREWIGLAVLVLPTVLISIDIGVLHLAIPMLSADLRPSSSELLWITDSYGFLIAGFLITMGAIGDRIGRKKLLLIGATGFAVASASAAFAPTAELLILARALLGVTAATLMPSTLSLIRTMFRDPAQRTVAISVWMTGFTGGMVIGPLVGGVLLENFWWGSVFLLGVPVMVLLLVTGPALLPEYRDPHARPVDLPSVPLSLGAVIAAIYGLKEIAAYGWGVLPFGAVLAGVALGVAFVRRQRRVANPMLDLTLFANRSFSVALGTLSLVILVGPGLGLLTSQYLQLVLGLSPLEAGLWTLPQTAAVIIGFLVTPALTGRFRTGTVTAVGLVIGAAGVSVLTLVGPTGELATVVTGMALFFLGGAPLLVLGTDLVVGAAPPERAGAASALSETAQEFGGALGLAVFGSIAAAVYRNRIAVPQGVPADAATAARDTLGGAAASAQDLPGDLAAPLLNGARAAFTSGLQTAALAGAGVLLVAAGLSGVLLRRAAPAAEAAEPVDDAESYRTSS